MRLKHKIPLHRTFCAGRAAGSAKQMTDRHPPESSTIDEAKLKENEILRKKMEEVKAKVHGSKKARSSLPAETNNKTEESKKVARRESLDKGDEDFENDPELKKTLEEVKRIAEESARQHQTLFSKIKKLRGGKLEPHDRSFLLLGNDKEEEREDEDEEEKEKEEKEEEEKKGKGKRVKMLIEELD